MAKCDLRVELNDANLLYRPGDRITGRVIVRATASVKSDGLIVSTGWKTHGRGNRDSGEGDSATLHQGEWNAGQEYSYDFNLLVAEGPSTYHGHYLNIDHYVSARVDIPWAFDPKAEAAHRVLAHPTDGEDSDSSANGSGCGKLFGSVFGIVFVLIFSVVILFNPFAWIFGFLAGSVVLAWWVFFRYLPAKALGEITCQFQAEHFQPNEAVSGTLSITPPQNVSTEGVTWKIVATEKCISGSGTNRSTHTHKAYESTQQLAPRGTLPGGVETKFAFEQILPKDPLFSVNLSDNNLEWTGELRVAISIWPDWVKKLRFKVVPPAQSSSWGAREIESNVAAPEVDEPEVAAPKVDEPDEWGIEIEEASLAVAPELVQEKELVQEQADTSGPAITFEETADMIWAVRDDLEQLGRVVDAVREVPLQISARIQRREIFGGRDEFAYDPGVSLRAIALDPPLPLTLYVREEQAKEVERSSGGRWQGAGQIVGYCNRRNRLLIRIE